MLIYPEPSTQDKRNRAVMLVRFIVLALRWRLIREQFQSFEVLHSGHHTSAFCGMSKHPNPDEAGCVGG